ncbi:hypothetical protein DFH11DRAFT_1678487, partial [Phellopilus nigrolimitatus]
MLNLVDTPSLDMAGPDALDRSLAEIIAFIEARFAESIEDVRGFSRFVRLRRRSSSPFPLFFAHGVRFYVLQEL